MAEYERKVREILARHNCCFVRRGKGDHDILTNCRLDYYCKSEHNNSPIGKDVDIMKREVRKLIKESGGKVSIESLEKYAGGLGYDVVFFNTADGDMLLRAYGMESLPEHSFTYCGSTRVIFVDGKLSTSNRIYAMLHELGHIVLGHMERLDTADRRTIENEAEAFAYSVLHYKKPKRAYAAAAILLLLCIGLFFYSKFAVPDVRDDCVFITGSGERYHRESCGEVTDKDKSAKLSKTEAEKILKPCRLCNP